MMRHRLRWSAAAFALIAVGLAVHWHGAWLGPDAQDIVGDALWAAMMYCLVGVLQPQMTRRARGAVALAICWSVEVSQLVRAPVLDAIRATTLGHLVLGSGFDVRDLLSYTIGVLCAVFVERRPRNQGTD